jgi:hypothetical protein
MPIKGKIKKFEDKEAKIYEETYSYNKFYLAILVIIIIFSPIFGFMISGILNVFYGWTIAIFCLIVGFYAITRERFRADFSKLKYLFIPNNTLNKEIMNFKEDRINKINANESPIVFAENLKFIIHLMPIDALSGVNYDLSKIEYNRSVMDNLLPIYPGSGLQPLAYNHNFEGFFVYEVPKEGCLAYVQLFRSGIIESVQAAYPKHRKSINIVYNERDIIQYVSMYLRVLETLGVETPIKIFLTLTGAKGYSMYSLSPNAVKIERDILHLPDVSIENYDDEIERILKPVFDIVQNACGHSESPNYDENGEWVGK